MWQPYYAVHKEKLERVQNRFLKRIGFKLGIPYENINCEEIRKLLNLSSLESRRNFFDVCLLYKILNNIMDTPELLADIGLHISPINSRNSELFYINFHRTNYGLNSPISRLCKLTNDVMKNCDSIDIFNDSFNQFRSKVRQHLLT